MAPLSGKKASKPVYKTDIPFTETKWPHTSPQDQQVILDLLCNLIEPLGIHRKIYISPSAGKKRKRKEESNKESPPAPAPPLTHHLLIGLNSITRHLSAQAGVETSPYLASASKSESATPTTDKSSPSKIAVLIIPTLTPSASLAHAHLPTLLHLSAARPSGSTHSALPRLVTLPPSSENRIASALHIPRVGAIAVLESAPGADFLIQYVREKVGFVECAYIDQGLKAEWKGIKGSF
ncbi:hypothetical protein K504DRAFT_396169 [Pleomassaria siparia CBS 279.74]|uniref:Uncharacterized protein n=1 Tax=Pleomassaria siparia CBS 279.74 TaxID=1314801 RepID=A0A6G1KQF8_9PLEO|nr:hypothetical protein K504DRAFT_396169 [Pleomassaria siparia CBS 279.74]